MKGYKHHLRIQNVFPCSYIYNFSFILLFQIRLPSFYFLPIPSYSMSRISLMFIFGFHCFNSIDVFLSVALSLSLPGRLFLFPLWYILFPLQFGKFFSPSRLSSVIFFCFSHRIILFRCTVPHALAAILSSGSSSFQFWLWDSEV